MSGTLARLYESHDGSPITLQNRIDHGCVEVHKKIENYAALNAYIKRQSEDATEIEALCLFEEY